VRHPSCPRAAAAGSLPGREYFGPRTNTPNVDEEFLLGEALTTVVGEAFYPGDSTPSGNWPGLAPGARGVLNTMTPKYCRPADVVDLARKPPITWRRGGQERVISDTSLFGFGYLGQIGAVPGWPGEALFPPQPMVGQTRAVLDAYRANGGVVDEVALEDAAHGMVVEVPQKVAEVIAARLVRQHV
jgi:hypothetical protein